MDDRHTKLRLTLDEIERLMAAADAVGAAVEPWIVELAGELRATLAGGDGGLLDGAGMAGRMRSDPARSLGAQAPIAARAARILKG
jgi:hypothetical protein